MDFMMNIKANSNTLHKAVETTGFTKRLLDGQASKESYAEYLFNLHAMYVAIETELEKHSDNEVVSILAPKELYRSKVIEKDLKFLLGDTLSDMTLLASTKACVARIKEISESQPELITAHAYTRFLADLFGGRLFLKLLTENYKITSEGLNYYSYDNLGDPMKYVMNYHNKLNSVQLSEELQKAFIDEISNNYIYNLAISNELETKLFVK